MTHQKNTSRPLAQELRTLAGEAVVKSNSKTVHIEKIISGRDDLPDLIIATYLKAATDDQYLFYPEELIFPTPTKLRTRAV
jgi:hypothetical protein